MTVETERDRAFRIKREYDAIIAVMEKGERPPNSELPTEYRFVDLLVRRMKYLHDRAQKADVIDTLVVTFARAISK